MMESPELRLRHARHVQGPEARPLTQLRRRCARADRDGGARPASSPSQLDRRLGPRRRMPSLTFRAAALALLGRRSIVFPLVAMYLVARQRRRGAPHGPVALHRLPVLAARRLHRHPPLLSAGAPGASLFIPVFLAILYCNGRHSRRARGRLAHPRRDLEAAHSAVQQADAAARRARPTRRPQRALAAEAQASETASAGRLRRCASRTATAGARYRAALALLLGAMLLGRRRRCCPWLVRRRARARGEHCRRAADRPAPEVHQAGTAEDPTLSLHTPDHRRASNGSTSASASSSPIGR